MVLAVGVVAPGFVGFRGVVLSGLLEPRDVHVVPVDFSRLGVGLGVVLGLVDGPVSGLHPQLYLVMSSPLHKAQ